MKAVSLISYPLQVHIRDTNTCFEVRPGDYIGFMFPDAIVPITYEFQKNNPAPLAFTTLHERDPVPSIGSIMDFDVLMFPWRLNIMATYDTLARC